MKTPYSLLFILISLLLSTLSSSGQTSKFQTGVEGGPTYCFIWENKFPEPHGDPILGGTLGVFFQYSLNNLFSVKTSLSYERKGYQYDNIAFPGSTIFSYYDYLVMPVLIKINCLKNGLLFMNTGAYFGYMIHHAEKYDHPTDLWDNWNYNKFDCGLSFGVGSTIHVTRVIGISLEIRNNFGLYDIQSEFYNMAKIPKFNNS